MSDRAGPPTDAAQEAPDARSASGRAIDFRVGPLQPLASILREGGLDASLMLERCGLPSNLFDDPLRRIDFQQGARLLSESAEALKSPELGLLIGQRFDFASFGLLAPLMQSAPTVGAALQSMQRHFHVHDRGGVPYVTIRDGHVAALGYTLFSSATPGIAMIFDMSLAVAWRMLGGLCGPSWKAAEVLVAHHRPLDPAPYKRLFRAPLQFDAPWSEVRFDAAWLVQPVAGADAAIEKAARQAAERATDADDRRVARRAHAAVQALVMTGHLSEQRVASVLTMHERSLRRALRDEGTSLKVIVAEARCEVAEQLLSQTRLPVGDIAQALKYRHAAAFSRAFRTWTGTTPRRWREAHGPDLGSGTDLRASRTAP
jgi:AraC-like DNA-binding protein